MEQLTLFLIFSCFISGIISKKEASLNFKLVCYENSNVLNSDFAKCDPNFVICISRKLIKGMKKNMSIKKCPIYYGTITQFSSKELSCSTTKGNTKIPFEFHTKALTIADEDKFFVAISVRHCEKADIFQTTYLANNSVDIDMEKNQFGKYKSNVRLKIELKTVNVHLMKKCKSLCDSLHNDEICFGNKQKFCKTSQQQCSTQDTILYKKCLDQGECKRSNQLGHCSCTHLINMKLLICTNNQSDFNNYKQCANNVRLFLSKLAYLDSEPKRTCENPINFCKLESCYDGCITGYNEHSGDPCICKQGFSGPQCDIKIIHFIWIPLTACVMLIIISVLIIFYAWNKKQGKKLETKTTTLPLNQLDSEKTKDLIQQGKYPIYPPKYLVKNIYQFNKDDSLTYEDLDNIYLEPIKPPPENESHMSILMSLPKRDPGKPCFLKRQLLKIQGKNQI